MNRAPFGDLDVKPVDVTTDFGADWQRAKLESAEEQAVAGKRDHPMIRMALTILVFAVATPAHAGKIKANTSQTSADGVQTGAERVDEQSRARRTVARPEKGKLPPVDNFDMDDAQSRRSTKKPVKPSTVPPMSGAATVGGTLSGTLGATGTARKQSSGQNKTNSGSQRN